MAHKPNVQNRWWVETTVKKPKQAQADKKAHIAAKLNLLSDGPACPELSTALAAADALIGNKVVPPVGGGSLSPGASSSLTGTLASYNEGALCGPHCGDPGAELGSAPANSKKAAWGQIKVRYR